MICANSSFFFFLFMPDLMGAWNHLLCSLGFRKTEADVYLTLLFHGPLTIQELSKKASVSRVTIYTVIQTLGTRGLLVPLQKGKRRVFAAGSPDRLLPCGQNYVQRLQSTLRELEGSLHQFKMIQQGHKPIIKLFEGKEALEILEQDILKCRPETIDEFGNYDQMNKVHGDQNRIRFLRGLARLQPRIRSCFLTKNPHTPKEIEPNCVWLDPGEFSFYGSVLVYANKISLSTFHGKHISVIIESADLANTVRALFDVIWIREHQISSSSSFSNSSKAPSS